jgi:hypothetical protein
MATHTLLAKMKWKNTQKGNIKLSFFADCQINLLCYAYNIFLLIRVRHFYCHSSKGCYRNDNDLPEYILVSFMIEWLCRANQLWMQEIVLNINFKWTLISLVVHFNRGNCNEEKKYGFLGHLVSWAAIFAAGWTTTF